MIAISNRNDKYIAPSFVESKKWKKDWKQIHLNLQIHK